MLQVNSKKERTIFYNQKKRTLFHKRFLLIFFFLILISAYVVYENFLFVVQISDESMIPSLAPGDTAIFKPIDIEEGDELEEIIGRGAVIAIRKPHIPEFSILRKIFDIPVYLLTLGWVKLNHREVVLRRLLAYPGERLEIRNKVIYLNNRVFLPEWIIKYQDVEIFPSRVTPRDNLESSYIDKGHVFLLNDNWDRINDSRLFGEISVEDIEGVLIYNYRSKGASNKE